SFLTYVIYSHTLVRSYFLSSPLLPLFFFFFFNAPATTEIYTLSLHDALPIFLLLAAAVAVCHYFFLVRLPLWMFRHTLYRLRVQDRKSTRLNSSHVKISYAVFCLKKKKKKNNIKIK